MPDHTSQRLIWLAWMASVMGTFLLSTFGRPMQHWTYANLGKGLAAWIIGGLLVLCVVLVLRWMWMVNAKIKLGSESGTRKNTNAKPIYWIGLLLIAAVAIIISVLDRPEERLHFVTFGLYGFFTSALFTSRSLLIALTLVCLFAGLDELYQWWLPDRVGDWCDVAMNVLAGGIGLVLQLIGSGWFEKRKSG